MPRATHNVRIRPKRNTFEIDFNKEMVSGVIFGVEYLILATYTKMLGRMVFFGVYVWPFWGSDGAHNGWGW